jgi:hydrogenase large subunit
LSQRIVIDPITRIEGHLRIEVAIDENQNVVQALSAGTQVRGIEIILRGRDPRDAWAFAQRICGVCTLVHGLASVRAVEDALHIDVPENAELIRDLMAASQLLQDHVIHFYHLQALDWVNPVNALQADPQKTSAMAAQLGYAETSAQYFAAAQTRLQDLVTSGQLGIFANGYWDHPGYVLPPEVNLIAIAHYLDALAWQREIGQVLTIFGGKNPHPNVAVGGAPCAITPGDELPGGGDATAVSLTGLLRVRQLITVMQIFIDEVYLPDLVNIGSFYKDWFTRGENVRNFITYGDFQAPAAGNGFGVPRGVVLNRDLSQIYPVDLTSPDQIQEYVAHSWYKYEATGAGLHPYAGETVLDYTGPPPPFEQLDENGTYSWVKSPRWRGQPMEMGPLARIVLLHAAGNEAAIQLTAATLAKLGLPFDAMYSTMGRILARGIESKLMVDRMAGWHARLMANIAQGNVQTFNTAKWEPASWPDHARGVGTIEGPRGALGHWIIIDNGAITNYQAVVPTTWNAGPMDDRGQHGPYEAALIFGHHLVIPQQPLEVLRTIHSFDPCMACAAHVFGPAGEPVVQVKIR